VTDDIRALTARMADEPGSLAFLELAEALRRRGQLDAAHKVARGGLSRYPGLADAHDLMARILSDQGDLAGAFDAWASALQLDPMRVSALKGVGFLYFRAGETEAALDHLQRALEVDPDDGTIRQALSRIVSPGAGAAGVASAGAAPPTAASAAPREAPAARPSASIASAPPAAAWEPTEPVAAGPFDAVDGGDRGLLLVDANGLRLGGRLADQPTDPAGDRVAAQLAGVSREAARATRLLGLGTWHTISVESPDGHVVLTPASADTVVVAAREPSLPMARVGLLAERAARAARGWLEDQT
jgi:tetratricopeptide (TPR) repeat protein